VANLQTAILGLCLAAVLTILGLQIARDPFSQRNFVCQEDEALVFIDTPTKDRTGCVNLDRLD